MKNKYFFTICRDIDTGKLRPAMFSIYDKDISGLVRFKTYMECQKAIDALPYS